MNAGLSGIKGMLETDLECLRWTCGVRDVHRDRPKGVTPPLQRLARGRQQASVEQLHIRGQSGSGIRFGCRLRLANGGKDSEDEADRQCHRQRCCMLEYTSTDHAQTTREPERQSPTLLVYVASEDGKRSIGVRHGQSRIRLAHGVIFCYVAPSS